jgi:hypothetical protein
MKFSLRDNQVIKLTDSMIQERVRQRRLEAVRLNRRDPFPGLSETASYRKLDTPEKYRALQLFEGLKVIEFITWCVKEDITAFGCADPPGGRQSMVVVRLPEIVGSPSERQQFEATLWLHEYGHTKGLDHQPNPELNDAAKRLDVKSDPEDFMLESGGLLRGKVSYHACRHLRKGLSPVQQISTVRPNP